MRKLVFSPLAVLALVQFTSGVASYSPSLAQEWGFGVKPRGTLKIVDFFHLQSAVIMNYAEGLVMLDKDSRWAPCLAQDYRRLDDRTVEFKLRKGVTFHNGEEFNAEVVKINWEHYKRLDSPRPLRIKGYILPKETIIDVVDDYTVRFTFPEADGILFPKFQWFFMFAPTFFDQHEFEEKSWGYLREAGLWGTGPYRMVEGSLNYPLGPPSDRVVLEAYEDYWDPKYPKTKTVIFENKLIGVRKEAMRLCREEEGAVDIVTHIRPLDTLKVAESRFAKVVKSKDVALLFGIFNQRKKDSKWRDIRLRKAVNYAINREELWRYAAKGNAFNLGGFIPADTFGHNPDLNVYNYDTDRARSLLAEAGYPDGFAVKIMTAEAWKLEGQIISRMLERVGLRAELEILTAPGLMGRLYIPAMDIPAEERDWDIAITYRPDWCNYVGISLLDWDLLEGSHYRWIEYDPVYEDMFDMMVRTVTSEAQERKLREMISYVFDRAYRMFIYTPLSLYAVNKEVNFVPQKYQFLVLKETSVTENHWSVRDQE